MQKRFLRLCMALSKEEMLDRIADYHENDIAEAFELLSESERKSWYQMFGPEQIAEIFRILMTRILI